MLLQGGGQPCTSSRTPQDWHPLLTPPKLPWHGGVTPAPTSEHPPASPAGPGFLIHPPKNFSLCTPKSTRMSHRPPQTASGWGGAFLHKDSLLTSPKTAPSRGGASLHHHQDTPTPQPHQHWDLSLCLPKLLLHGGHPCTRTPPSTDPPSCSPCTPTSTETPPTPPKCFCTGGTSLRQHQDPPAPSVSAGGPPPCTPRRSSGVRAEPQTPG